jgi:hypothetical protein
MEDLKLNPHMTVSEVAYLAQNHQISIYDFENWVASLPQERLFQNTDSDLERYFQNVQTRELAHQKA